MAILITIIMLSFLSVYLIRENKRLKDKLEIRVSENELLRHNYDTVRMKYFELVNSDEYKELVGRK